MALRGSGEAKVLPAVFWQSRRWTSLAAIVVEGLVVLHILLGDNNGGNSTLALGNVNPLLSER